MTIQKITSIKELLHNLEMGLGYDGYTGLINQLELNTDELEEYYNWSDEHYTRNLVYRGDTVEVLIMCWSPGNKSLVHSYDNQQGWMKVVDGTLDVDFYMAQTEGKKMTKYQSKTLLKNDPLYINDYLGFHAVENRSNERALSIHIHAEPIKNWRVYDPITDTYFNTPTIYEKG